MANPKEYAYYVVGNKVGIVEKDVNFDNDPNSKDYGPGIEKNAWKSPLSSVTDGLKVEYLYNPIYTLGESELTPQINQFYINGWTVKDGYLTFLRSHSAAVASWDASPYSAVADDEYIVVQNSNKWNGLHKIKDGAADGTLQTYTKVNLSLPRVIGSSNIDIAGELAGISLINSNDASNIWLNATFSTGDYIYISGSAEAVNNGFWKVSGVAADSSAESSSGIYIKNRYYCYDSDSTLSTEGEDTTINTTAAANESTTIYKAYRDFCYILADVNTLNDESDDIDVPSYLNKALVYYVKAKMSEDMRDMEGREYFMREFRRMVEKHQSSLVKTGRFISSGAHSIR